MTMSAKSKRKEARRWMQQPFSFSAMHRASAFECLDRAADMRRNAILCRRYGMSTSDAVWVLKRWLRSAREANALACQRGHWLP